jgi:ATP-dependent Lhr-like helicase
MSEADIKRSLTRTWFPFFSRFGRLTRIQVQTIPLILEGRNVVVISPSASGKTEAVVAPVVERLLPEHRKQFSILYVSPTRALVNDLYRRLVDPVQYLELAIARKTGDRPEFDEAKPPFLLITTPESLDSLLCRHPKTFQHLKTVVLDELHLLDNTPRGDQLRVLLERLRRVRSGLSFHALSATIEDEKIGERYFADPQVVKTYEDREIEYVLLRHDKNLVPKLYRELQERRLDKILCFFNARSFVEMYSRTLDQPPFSGKVWVHHASLTKPEREHTEHLMTTEKRGVLCATSTLELGIDIGDVDAVVLFRPPFSITSLLQRIGRGNRRTGGSLFAVGIYENDWEKLLFETFFDCARHGLLYEKRYRPCLSVLPQQTFSYLFQRRRIGATFKSLERILEPVCSDPEITREMFQYLVEQDYLKTARPGIYYVTSKLERETTRGKIHSNIQEKSFGDYEVIDSESGQVIGRVFFLFARFVLSGRTWEVVERREKEKRVFVRCRGRVEATSKVFEGTGTGGYFYLFARQLKARIFPELEENEFPFFRDAGNIYLYHFLGELYGSLLCAALGLEGFEVQDCAGRLFAWPERRRRLTSGQTCFPVPDADDVRAVIGEQITILEDRLGSGAFFRMLPEQLQIEDHFQTLDITGLLEFLGSLRLVEVEPSGAHRQFAGIKPPSANN